MQMKHRLHTLLRLAPLALAAAFLASCASTPRQFTGETLYLGGLTVPAPNLTNPQGQQGPPDNFSYWEGGGNGPARIIIDISDQAAYFYRGDHLAGQTLVSTGTPSHPTPLGSFKIFRKVIDHKSSVYGWIRDANDNVVNYDADIRKHKIPPGGYFDHAKMHFYLNFAPAIGMHKGILPGYPASHGCVRLPEHMAKAFFENASVGTPVTVRP
jgi:lipoprotein-anchoring transpeptidase ErfK/SrfK